MNTKTESVSFSPAGTGFMHGRYESSMGPARTHILELAQSTVLDPGIDPCVLQLFLIHFSAQGVGMTEPVESWVDRAGQRCEQIGLAELGRFLRKHASEEANHHLWFIEDLRLLVPMWNVRATESLDVHELLQRPMTGGVHRYRKLFEDVIGGDASFAELAIEYGRHLNQHNAGLNLACRALFITRQNSLGDEVGQIHLRAADESRGHARRGLVDHTRAKSRL